MTFQDSNNISPKQPQMHFKHLNYHSAFPMSKLAAFSLFLHLASSQIQGPAAIRSPASQAFSQDTCALKLREQTQCYSQLQVDFGRHLRKCAEQVCPFGKKRRKREGGFKEGVKLLQAKYNELERCAKNAVRESLINCDLLTYRELGRSFYDYIPCDRVRECFQERANMKDFALANEECANKLPSSCKQPLHVSKCVCVQAAKSEIDTKCPGFFLAKVDCFSLRLE